MFNSKTKQNPIGIIGMSSLIGVKLARVLSDHGENVVGTSRQRIKDHLFLDFDQPCDQWPGLPQLKTLVICASMNSVDHCEMNVTQSFKKNVEAVGHLIGAYASKQTQVVFFSSSHVFDGSKPFRKDTEKPHPKNTYGLHKMLAEEIVLHHGGTVIRLTKVIGPNFSRFQDWVNSLRAGQKIRCLSDLYTSLISLENTVNLIKRVIDLDTRGIIHFSGPEDRSYYNIAQIIAKRLGLDEALIESQTQENTETSTKINHTTLQNSEFVREIGISNPNTRELIGAWCKHLE